MFFFPSKILFQLSFFKIARICYVFTSDSKLSSMRQPFAL
ncbi:hypothetical protein D1AOALGA4SA_11010 [Olavius algarvensis Delta 1 endosymbiont]|nr:hypothetical protein D1AOALGA4SA_11010 [Olavius algarvensis Delta 1 endosymbiont]